LYIYELLLQYKNHSLNNSQTQHMQLEV